VVHEAQVSFSGAVDLTHADLPETSEELSPNVLPETVPNTHEHLVILLILCLTDTHKAHQDEAFHNQFYSIQIYLYSAFHNIYHFKAALQNTESTLQFRVICYQR